MPTSSSLIVFCDALQTLTDGIADLPPSAADRKALEGGFADLERRALELGNGPLPATLFEHILRSGSRTLIFRLETQIFKSEILQQKTYETLVRILDAKLLGRLLEIRLPLNCDNARPLVEAISRSAELQALLLSRADDNPIFLTEYGWLPNVTTLLKFDPDIAYSLFSRQIEAFPDLASKNFLYALRHSKPQHVFLMVGCGYRPGSEDIRSLQACGAASGKLFDLFSSSHRILATQGEIGTGPAVVAALKGLGRETDANLAFKRIRKRLSARGA